MAEKKSQLPAALNVVGVVSAAIVGCPIWYIFLMLFTTNSVGKAGIASVAVAFAPVVGVAIPFAWPRFRRAPGIAAWMLALAPLVGVANLWALMIVTSQPGYVEPMFLIFIAIWLIPLVVIVVHAVKFGDRSS
ncbi:MAG: hypothetical protein V4484_08925 [Pseudomonadota bacterium]